LRVGGGSTTNAHQECRPGRKSGYTTYMPLLAT
jgi:hypothetical protein